MLSQEKNSPSNTHLSCQAIVVSCLDFRLQKMVFSWAKEKIPGGFDYLSLAGGVKNLLFVLEQVNLSHRLHQIKEVYLINHEDCGAYGKDSTFPRHQKDLLLTKKALQERFPQLKITCFFLKLNGQFIPVSEEK